jgi:hypothetical protein
MSQACANPLWRRALRLAFLVLVVLTMLKVWTGAELVRPASAQIPNAGAQRLELLDEAKRTNALLTDILATLRAGPLKVEVVGTDNNVAAPRATGGRTK